MVARGKARASRVRPAVTPRVEEQFSQFVSIVLERLHAMEDRFAGSYKSAPQIPPVVQTVVPPVFQPVPISVPVSDQEFWLRLIARFQKLRVPEFHGGSDPLVADKWKEDTDSALSYMGVDSIQRQRLAAYSLKGDAGIWYRSHFSAAERLTTSWEDFLQSFDSQFISSASRAGKEAELLALEQGDMSVDDYESKFISLSHFTDNMFQSEERKARMFERGLRPQIRRLVVSQRLRTLGDVVDSARALEIDFFSSQKTKDTTTRTATQAAERGQGKRPLAGEVPQQRRVRPHIALFHYGHDSQQYPQYQYEPQDFQRQEALVQGGPDKQQRFSGRCSNCGRHRHRAEDCRFPQKGPEQSYGQQQYEQQSYWQD